MVSATSVLALVRSHFSWIIIFVFTILTTYIASYFVFREARLFGNHVTQAVGAIIYYPFIRYTSKPIRLDTDILARDGLRGTLQSAWPSRQGTIVTILNDSGRHSFNTTLGSAAITSWGSCVGQPVTATFVYRYGISNAGSHRYVVINALSAQ